MQRRHIFVGAVIALALLLPLGRWLYGMYQDAADRKASLAIEKQFANRLPTTNATQGQPSSLGGPNGRMRRGGGQGRPGGGQRGQRGAQMMAEMAKEVDLSPTQVKQVQAVQESTRPLMGDLFRNPNLTRDQKREQMQQLRAAQQAQISKILSPDQQTKYAAFQEKVRAQWQARRQANGSGYGGGGRPGSGETN
jgi:hypothetical protein